jgi:hypothetical protein
MAGPREKIRQRTGGFLFTPHSALPQIWNMGLPDATRYNQTMKLQSLAIILFAVWFNPSTPEKRDGAGFVTVHSMAELLARFQQAT